MPSAAQKIPAVSTPDSNRVELIYIRPFGDHRSFEARMADVVARFGERVRFSKTTTGNISRFTKERIFVSPMIPVLVVIRAGEVLAQAVGDLPAREIERLLYCADA